MYSIAFFQRTWQRRRRSGRRPKFRPQVRSQDPPRHGVSVPGNGKCNMPHARPKGWRGSRRARWKRGLYSAEALAEQKRVRELLSRSREETDASRLSRVFTVLGVHPRFCPIGARLSVVAGEYSILTNSNQPRQALAEAHRARAEIENDPILTDRINRLRRRNRLECNLSGPKM